jgi:hypothetical protein
MNVMDRSLLAADWKERNDTVSAAFMRDWPGKFLDDPAM